MRRRSSADLVNAMLTAPQYLPPWKSYYQLIAIQKTASRKQRTALMEEIYGIVAEEEEGFFPDYLIKSLKAAPQVSIDEPPRTIWLAVDPASHQSSEIGLAAITYERGHVLLLGTASVRVGKGDMKDCCAAITSFAELIVECRGLDTAAVVPIIECNHSEVVAREILDALQRSLGAKISLPWTGKKINHVTDGLGIWTTARANSRRCSSPGKSSRKNGLRRGSGSPPCATASLKARSGHR